MQSFFEWFPKQQNYIDQNWLVLGKGPSFAKRHQYDLDAFKTVALNHAVREQPVTLSHVIDLDVLQDCGEEVERNAAALVMPWVPHVNNCAGTASLEELVGSVPLLRKLDQQHRLLWYNLSTTTRRHGNSPVVPVRWFSIEAVLNLLAGVGVRTVRSLGIDGGASYSQEFDDLTEKTLLANGHESFDCQFAEVAKTICRTGLDYAPLDIESPIRIYVGTMEEQMLAVRVLEYSIRKHASMTVEVLPLHRAPIEMAMPRDAENAPRTPFSFQRFLIPQLAGYHGRAIYLDSDMQLFRDLRHLWALPFDGAELLAVSKPSESERPLQFSVMLLNCDVLRWNIQEIIATLDRGELTYQRLMQEMGVARKVRYSISPFWNSLESYKEGQTALLHYTDMPTQPWVSCENPLGYLWMRDLLEAIDNGFITLEFAQEHVARGWVRPSLLYQIEHQVEDSLLLPAKARRLDQSFVAPYRRMGVTLWAPRTRYSLLAWRRVKRVLRTVHSKIKSHQRARRLAYLIGYRKRPIQGH